MKDEDGVVGKFILKTLLVAALVFVAAWLIIQAAGRDEPESMHCGDPTCTEAHP